MSWGIDFTAEIYLSRQDYGESIHCVQDEIDDLTEKCQDIKERMLMMVVGGTASVNTKDVADNECDPVDVLHTKFTDLLQLYNEYQGQISDLYRYKAYLEKQEEKKKLSVDEKVPVEGTILNKGIGQLKIPATTFNALCNAGICTVAKLIKCSAQDLKTVRGFGGMSLIRTRNALYELGLHLRGEEDWFKAKKEWDERSKSKED